MKTGFALPLIASTMCLTGCFSSSEKLHDYMAQKEYPMKTLDSVLNATKRDDFVKEAIVRQSTVDAMAYRDLFYSTELAKDSSAVAEFNKIAQNASLENVKINRWEVEPLKKHIIYIAKKDGISIDEADELKSALNKYARRSKWLSICESASAAKIQFFSDKYFYENYFKGYNLLNDTIFTKKLKETADCLKPKKL